MSIGFINALKQQYPGAVISVIAKKGIHGLLDLYPINGHHFIFSKKEYPGLQGLWQFGRMINKTEKFDLFFCLPDSFSSAFMAYASGAKKRIGYKKEIRSLFLTHSFPKSIAAHRVEQYIDLLRKFTQNSIPSQPVLLKTLSVPKNEQIIVNINSEASSRRLPVHTAIKIISQIQKQFSQKLYLIGGIADAAYVNEVINQLPEKKNIENAAGKTSLQELAILIAGSKIVLSTDSGPAHVANALSIPTVVLFGAGNEFHTAPYNAVYRSIIRLGKLTCEPCVKNVCVLYGTPKCLELLDEKLIVNTMLAMIH